MRVFICEVFMLKILHILSTTSKSFGDMSVIMNYYKHVDLNKIYFDFATMLEHQDKLDKDISDLGGRVFHFNKPKSLNDIKFSIKTIRNIVETNNYDIVHLHVPVLHSIVKKAIKGLGVKLIIHSHSTKLSTSAFGKIRNYFLTRGVSKSTNGRWACSVKAAKTLFGQNWGSNDGDCLINNAIDLKDFSNNKNEYVNIRRNFGLKDDTMAICHVGRFNKEKNHYRLIDVFAEINTKIQNSVLFLIGDGPLKIEIMNYVNKKNLKDKVFFMGLCNNVSKVIVGMDVFILPSLFEGLSLSLIEAQAAGLLCFCSDNCVKDSAVTNNLTRISLKISDEEWANIIINKYLAGWNRNTSEMISSMGYNIELESIKLIDKYEDVYNNA